MLAVSQVKVLITNLGSITLDFRFTQELPGFLEDHKGILYFDVKNVLNLMNDDWGVVEYQSFGSKILVDHNYDADTGVYTYSVPYGQDGIETANQKYL